MRSTISKKKMTVHVMSMICIHNGGVSTWQLHGEVVLLCSTWVTGSGYIGCGWQWPWGMIHGDNIYSHATHPNPPDSSADHSYKPPTATTWRTEVSSNHIKWTHRISLGLNQASLLETRARKSSYFSSYFSASKAASSRGELPKVE